MLKSLMELHGMLKNTRGSMIHLHSTSSATPILANREGGVTRKKTFRPKGKGKGKIRRCNPKPKKIDSEIAPVSKPHEAMFFYYQ